MLTLGDNESAIDELISREPGNIAALIRKADIRTEAGDDKVATAFYRAALKAASQNGSPAELAQDLQRAQAASQRALRRFEDYLEASLTEAGFAPGHRPARFQESLDILMGRRPAVMELQQPRSYFYPGLPQRRYYEREEFAWREELEQQTAAIREEALALARSENGFAPYLYHDPSRPPRNAHGLIDSPDWSTLHLWENGEPIPENVERCPVTVEAMQKVDLAYMGKRAPCVMFSMLKARAHIPAHNGLLNMRLVCHLALVVPDGCEFRVGGERRKWHEGQLLVFDDSVVHEAVNNSDQDRIVLIFEIWRPELTLDERRAVNAVFAALDSYGG